MGLYDTCSSSAVSPSRCTTTTGFLTDDYLASRRVNQAVSTGMDDAVLAMERSPIRCAQTVTMAGDSLYRSTPETFATALAHRHTAEALRVLLSRYVEHTSGAVKVPIVALEETRLFELKPGGCEVRLIASAATAALRVASAREPCSALRWTP
jgi:hypothetical protein